MFTIFLDIVVHSDQKEQLWVWEYEMEGGKHDMFMDIDEEIRFRVESELFVDTSPTSGEGRSHTHAHTRMHARTHTHTHAHRKAQAP